MEICATKASAAILFSSITREKKGIKRIKCILSFASLELTLQLRLFLMITVMMQLTDSECLNCLRKYFPQTLGMSEGKSPTQIKSLKRHYLADNK